MEQRLPIVDNLCTNPENHHQHLCELRLAGKETTIASLQQQPRFVCGNCGGQANQQGALCAPGPLDSCQTPLP